MSSNVYDRPGSLSRLGGDVELFRELVGYFLEDCPEMLDQIHLGLGEQDSMRVERAAHSLKGLAANFGAARVVASAQTLEDLARQRKLEPARDVALRLDKEVGDLKTALAENQ